MGRALLPAAGFQPARVVPTSLQPPLAALLFTSAAWRMAPRDQFIGWSDQVRERNLPLVINNSHFLIFPWIRIPHLASHVLAQARRLSAGAPVGCDCAFVF